MGMCDLFAPNHLTNMFIKPFADYAELLLLYSLGYSTGVITFLVSQHVFFNRMTTTVSTVNL